MEATKQAERAVKAWADTQIKVWESWIDTIQASTSGRSGVWDQVRKATIDSLEKSVSKTLDAQLELTHVLAETLSGYLSTAEDAAEKARIAEFDSITKSATDAQRQLWASWFDVAKKVDLTQFAAGWEKIVDAWQQAVRNALEAQAQWFEVQAQETRARTGPAVRKSEQ
jgi:hypothetical protein